MKECADVLRQILNSPQHPSVKNWYLLKRERKKKFRCAEIIADVSTRVAPQEPTEAENNEQINDEYLEVCSFLQKETGMVDYWLL